MHGGALSQGWHAFDVDGLQQSYEVAGSGRVCVVHSGGPGIESDYLRMPLLEDHLTMVYLDPIGTGRSSLLPGGEYVMPTYAHYFEAVLDHIGEPRPIVLGHSHGGMVALELAMRDPHRLGGLIAYDTAPVYDDALWEEAGRQMSAYAERWPDRPEAAVARRAWNGRREVRTDAASARQWLADVTPAYFADYHRVADGSLRPRPHLGPEPKQRGLVRTWPSRRHRHADVDHLRGIRLRLSATVVRADARRDTRIRPASSYPTAATSATKNSPTSSWAPCSSSSAGSSDASRTASPGGGSAGA